MPEPSPNPFREEVERTIRLLAAPGGVVEIRAIADDGTYSGYFSDPSLAAASAELLDLPTVHGIYLTLNEVNPALLARRANRVKMRLSRNDATTSDSDIIRRRWFPIDIDPVRPSGVSATKEEHDLAVEKAGVVAGWLRDRGFPEPVRGDSGNGAHLLYRIDLPNDDESRQLIQQCLAVLGELFSDGTSTIDTAVYNASRIWKLYGTVPRKGDHTPERPHRRSSLGSVPEKIAVVPRGMIEALSHIGVSTGGPGENEMYPSTGRSMPIYPGSQRGQTSSGLGHSPRLPGRTSASVHSPFHPGHLPPVPVHESPPARTTVYPDDKAPLDIRAWLRDHGIRIRSEKPWQGGRLFTLDECPFSAAHKDGAFVIQFATGAIHAGCHHAGCGGGKQRWQELRKKYDQEYAEREKQEAGQQQSAGREQEANEAGQQERRYAGQEQNTKRTGSQENQNVGQDQASETGQRQYAGCEQERRSDLPAGPEPPPQIEYALTDAGNAERLIALYGEFVRFCATSDSWFLWNGRVWEEDISRQMLLLATRVARSIYADALQAATPDRARQLARWAIASESLRHRKALIESAAPHAAVTHEVFDAKPNLLNCGNGTLELDTLHFREHRREDLLTKCAPVAYDKEAGCPLWKEHLSLIFDGDTEYITGFQAMCGYTLLQDNPEQVLFILFGRGRNGKSKTIEVLAEILGDYAVNIAAESLMVHRYEGARSDLARMAGARMATASEGEDGARLAESMVKQLTGEYAITVRRLYENEFEFTPTAKIWLTTNHEPVIRGTDDGIWRRIWMVPFTVQIPEEKRDPAIAEKLLAEGSGILNWCLEGLQQYCTNGNRLIKPGKVSVATGNYRTLSDTVKYFLATECVLEPGRSISRLAFRERFEKWCEEEGIRHPISARKFAVALKSHGIRNGGKSMGERFWTGIRWKTEEEMDLAEQKGGIQESLLGSVSG